MSTVFELVLGVFRDPGLVGELRDKQLPDDLAQVIRLAAGEDAALHGAMDSTGETSETLVEASVFFLQQVLFAPGVDSYRVLGAAPDSRQDRLRDNYRWLMKWLHPDRNQDGWEAVYADRVNIAWQDLKTPDRRADYDRRTPALSPMSPSPMSTSLVRRVAPVSHAPAGPLLSGSAVRRLPTMVLGTLGVVAAATIGIMYWAKSETARELAELQRERNEPAYADAPDEAPIADSLQAVTAAAPTSTDSSPDPIPMVSNAAPTQISEPAPALNAIDEPAIAPTPVALVEVVPLQIRVDPMTVASVDGMSITSIANPVPAPEAEITPVSVESLAAAALAQATAASSPESLPIAPPAVATMTVASSTAAPADSSPRPAVPARSLPTPPRPRTVTERTPAPVASASPAVAMTSRVEPRDPPPAAAPAVEETPLAVAKVEDPVPVLPAATPAPAVAPAQSDAEALVREFASAYASGDLARFDRLLSAARSDVTALDPMRSRFMSTEMRYLEIQQLRWHPDAEQGHVRARFRDTYVPRGSRKAVTESGEIEWTIRVDSGDVRIARVARDDAQP